MDIDKLRPEVQAAMEVIAGDAVCTCHEDYTSRGMKDPACNHDLLPYVETIRTELLRLADENKRMRGIIETLDIEGHRRARKAEAELAAMKARIAGSCRADGQRVFDLLGLPIEFDGTLALVKVEE